MKATLRAAVGFPICLAEMVAEMVIVLFHRLSHRDI